jgi:nicotinate-nucleotide pyrophosphorylase (carboxylating)
MSKQAEHLAAPDPGAVLANVRAALSEDLGDGDITAGLIPESDIARARVITREDGVLCGQPWVDAVFAELDPAVTIEWQARDGQQIVAGDSLFTLQGPARNLLTGERSALNFLQLLSGTATTCHRYAELVADTPVRLLDTRKTVPGLRIEENHIHACGGIASAVSTARRNAPDKLIEVEVETLDELSQALDAGCDRVMLDNFSLEQMREAVAITGRQLELEASGNVTEQTLRAIAETGVDYISIGALTKDCKALDLSMRLL